ncbi:hypothetical protein JBW_03688 [Pelosinus fermentans JBW45]|uniref:Uncharacterized protein n=1 Tax=Pelosinus fermentans JBW45 TaxID=1192197 RepID=I9DAU7_9FIRM|nr:hypothetical protein JBW_03688 [Pelosinus fermentans JBW45]
MTPASLVDNLCAYLQELLKDYVLEVQCGKQQTPKVLPGYLRPGENFGGVAAPFVLVGAVKGRDTSERASVQVNIWIGIYSQDPAVLWRGPLNLLEHIRQALFKKRIIANKFSIELPMRWEISREYTFPKCLAVMTTNWTVARPIEEVSYGQDPKHVSWSGAGDLLRP